ncbi:MAG: phosphate/phosphite/phosphonate ABC transporter substrate-binding protein [Planctomycetes bacterium]|nr:phosphate/phosphite/phosphonate ABC transporter substrate-binding protein [Planctomycetota bacterium]
MKLTLLALALLLPVTHRAPTPSKPATEDPQKTTLSLNFGVYQSDKATVMYKKLTPVLEYLQEDLERRIGRPVDLHLSIFKSYDEGIDALVKGQIDFVRFGPASYINAKGREPRLDLIAMEQENGEKRFRGVVIVRSDSPIQKLSDLKGKRFAFGDPNSTIGRYLIQAELVKAGIHASDLAGSKFLERHDKVAAAVEIGDFDAGAVATSTYEQANAKGTLRVIASFDNVTKPWVARAGFDPAVMAALRQSLLAIKDPAVLKELKVSGFVATSDEEYGFVREGMKVADEFEKRPGS